MDIVYVIHHFEAENEDEIGLRIGDPVIVLERDDGFEDGWWQVRRSYRPCIHYHSIVQFTCIGKKCGWSSRAIPCKLYFIRSALNNHNRWGGSRIWNDWRRWINHLTSHLHPIHFNHHTPTPTQFILLHANGWWLWLWWWWWWSNQQSKHQQQQPNDYQSPYSIPEHYFCIQKPTESCPCHASFHYT